jgi:hypothetical protein
LVEGVLLVELKIVSNRPVSPAYRSGLKRDNSCRQAAFR